jgi:small conductance mechanosensitive channel
MPRIPNRPDQLLDHMFETRSDAWEKVGLAMQVTQRTVRRAQREIVFLVPLFIGVVIVYADRFAIFQVQATPQHSAQYAQAHWAWQTPMQAATVIMLLILGWWVARDIGRAAAPTFFRRMDPATAGTVGFVVRLAALAITIVLALYVAGVSAGALVASSAFTAVILGLAAQQTLGNLIAGLVLLSARPFRVGERIRLQAGAVGGTAEGIVSSLGLLYTTLKTRGEDRIMIPNSVVLAAAIVPIREPELVDVLVRLTSGVRPTHVQALLDDSISVPTRRAARVNLQEVDGDDVVVRVQATPERPEDGARLADEIIDTLAAVTGDHEAQPAVKGD